jgi:pilus assembly protein CpaC
MGKLGGFKSVKDVFAALILSILLFATPVVEGAQQAPTITVTVNKSLVFGLAQKARRVSVTQPEVAEVVVLSPNQLLINGKSVGTTSLIVWPESGEVINYDLIVSADVVALRNQLRGLFPDEKIEVTTSAAAIVLKGEVSNEIVYDKLLEVVVNYLPPKPSPQVATSQTVSVRTVAEARTPTSGTAFAGGGQLAFIEEIAPTDVSRWANKREIPGVIDLLVIKEFHLLQLDVIVAEVSLSKARDLGVDIAAIINNSTAILSRAGSQAGFPSQLLADPSTFPPTTTFGDAASTTLSHLGGTIQFTTVWRLFQNKNIAQILARPNLVIKNGRSGGFLAGGEFPVIQSTEENLQVDFKPFGVRLDFLPTLTWSKTIDLRVFPEVSEIDQSVAVNGIPGLKVRRTVTRVEMQEGESLIIAGLIDRRILKDLTKFPFLGDIPILGTLFRSTRFRDQESELVIVVTPKIVRAMRPGEKPTLPLLEKYDDPDIRQVPLPSQGSKAPSMQGPTIP